MSSDVHRFVNDLSCIESFVSCDFIIASYMISH